MPKETSFAVCPAYGKGVGDQPMVCGRQREHAGDHEDAHVVIHMLRQALLAARPFVTVAARDRRYPRGKQDERSARAGRVLVDVKEVLRLTAPKEGA